MLPSPGPKLVSSSSILSLLLLSSQATAPKTRTELVRMAALFAEFTVYVVEVCRTCGWNHLVQSYVLGTGGLDTHKPRRRTAAE